jgi:hypothetical protein
MVSKCYAFSKTSEDGIKKSARNVTFFVSAEVFGP